MVLAFSYKDYLAKLNLDPRHVRAFIPSVLFWFIIYEYRVLWAPIALLIGYVLGLQPKHYATFTVHRNRTPLIKINVEFYFAILCGLLATATKIAIRAFCEEMHNGDVVPVIDKIACSLGIGFYLASALLSLIDHKK